jgi:hypothetical protein
LISQSRGLGDVYKRQNRHHLQMAYQMDKFLFTHAGVSPEFMDQIFGADGWEKDKVAYDLNEMFKYKPHAFEFNGFNAYGDNTYQTPIWIRPGSLMASNKKHKKGLKKDYIQVVGHTGVRQIDVKGKATNSKYYFIDALGTSGEYLIIENNQIRVNSVK